MKSKKKPKSDTFSKLLPIVLILAGITLLGTGVSTLVSQAGYQKTTAVITEITEEPYTVRGREKTALSAVAAYTLGDTVYTADLGGVRGGFMEGGQISVLVNPDVPQDAVLPQTAGGAVCTALGAALLLCSQIWFVPLLRDVFAGKEK